MAQLTNRNVVVGITGGIAAYKAAQLVRDLQRLGARVRVVMTRGATEFITPMTLQALSGHPVHLDLLDSAAEAAMGHIELARWADRVCVAPATADFLARLCAGRADDLLCSLCLATSAPLLIAPAMNQGMWDDPATAANVALLRERGITLLGPADGSQACGEFGPGRMEEPATIAAGVAASFESRLLERYRVVVTAGPTREALDPVRFISNHSSGKMGFAMAQACADAGAATTLISGPVALSTPARVERVDVTSAREMYDAATAASAQCDIFIACAAVSDYRPARAEAQKIKKSAAGMKLEMVRNPDILASIAERDHKPFLVGFAAETSRLEQRARKKLRDKNLDLIVANDVSRSDAGFHGDDNEVTALWAEGRREFALTSKSQLARQLVELIVQRMGTQ